jgi:hypothetical protein
VKANQIFRKDEVRLVREAIFLLTLTLIISIAVTKAHGEIVKGSVTSVQGRLIEMNVGTGSGARVGASGRVYYNVKIEGKEQPIFVAKFKITQIAEATSMAEIEEKTTDLRKGLLVEVVITSGELEVRSEPSGARVSLDDKEVGQTPLVLSGLGLGRHRIRVAKEEHYPYEEQIDLTGPERKRVIASLRRLVGELTVSTDPPGAGISIDGRPVGTSPFEGKAIPSGTSRVRIVKEGYETWERDVFVEAGKRIEVLAQLKVKEGSLDVQSDPSGARVFLDGNELGETPLTLSGIRLGHHRIRVTKEGYVSYEEQVTVTEGERKKVLASLRKMTGILSIRTEPPGANVFIDGKPVGTSPCESGDLPPGSYQVRIEKRGYAPWEGSLSVIAGKRIEVPFPIELKAVVGSLEILSEPSGSKVFLDGEEMGQTPLSLPAVRMGQHRVRVTKEDYDSYEEQVSVTEGERKKVLASLRKMTGVLSIRTEPSGASVFIDGKPVGTSPCESGDLAPGSYRVRIEKRGYAPWEGSLSVIAGKRIEVPFPIELKAVVGSLEILSEPSGSRVFLDGKEMGQTPLSLPAVRVGQHRIRVSREGYEPYEEQAGVRQGKNRVSASLKRLRGDLFITTEPSRSDIDINGKSVGVSPYEGKDLQPGIYKVKVSKTGYEPWKTDATVKAGEANELRVQLKGKKREVAAASPPSKSETLTKEPPKAPESPKVDGPPKVAESQKASSPPKASVPPKAVESPKAAESPKAGRQVDWANRSCDAPVWNVGDKWTYRTADKVAWTQEIVDVKEDAFIMKIPGVENLFAYDRKTMNRNYSIGKNGRKFINSDDAFKRLFEFPLAVGKTWSYTTPWGRDNSCLNHFEVEGVEEVLTPAGRFTAYKIYCKGKVLSPVPSASQSLESWARYWYSPEVKSWVKCEFDNTRYWSKTFNNAELIAFKLK